MTQLIIVIGLIAAFLAWSAIKKAPKAQQRKLRNRALLIGGAVILLIGILSGRLHPLIGALAAAVPALMRLATMVATLKSAGSLFGRGASAGGAGTPGQQSAIRTRFFEMTLDHDSGQMDGEVLAGSFSGRKLSSLSLDDLLALYAECAGADEQSRAVLEAYLDRERPDWRQRAGGRGSGTGGGQPPATTGMSRDEAAAILGVPVDADRDTVVSAHRRLMQKMHPDRGGSDYLAAQINKAKAVLLGG